MSHNVEYHTVNNLSILKFSGADAQAFLQGQLSNDINALASTWQYSGYCNHKGRLLALFQMWMHGDEVYATLDSSLLEAASKRLRMYVMRSKVLIEAINTASCIGEIGLDNTADRFSVTVDGDIHTLHYGDRDLLVDLSGALKGTNSTNWSLANITAGEPIIDSDNAELFVPQMVNLDLLGGINFKKGCYTGQEIVARMHYLGKLKQRMFVCKLEGEAKSGDRVIAADKSAGNIVSVADGFALAAIRRELVQRDLYTESGVQLVPLSQQPYTLPE